MSKKISNNISSGGLFNESHNGNWAVVEETYNYNDGSKEITIAYGHGLMPSHQVDVLKNYNEVEEKMREFEPDLRKWLTSFRENA